MVKAALSAERQRRVKTRNEPNRKKGMDHPMTNRMKITAALVAAMVTSATARIAFGPFSGAVTSTSAVVVYRLESSDTDLRIVYSTSEDLRNPMQSAAATSSSDHNNVVKVSLDNLAPATRYYYAPQIDGSVLSTHTGTFRTFGGGAEDFSIAFGNSLKTCRPDQSGMVASLDNDLLFFLNTGDMFYEDISRNDLNRFRNAYEDALSRECDSAVGASVPLVYMWDDHDYGPNNSDASASGRESSRRAYREHIPHYPLPAGEGDAAIYQALSVGTVRFILTDLRSERDRSHGTMMGSEQLQWFLDELSSASATHDLIIWVSTVPYTTTEGAGSDNWGGFEDERRIIANYIKDNGIDNMMIVSGDAHSVAAGDGSDADYADGGGAPLAEVLASPLDGDNTSIKGGPWNQGTYRAPQGTNAYGLLSVRFTDEEVIVDFSGRTDSHQEKVSLRKSFSRSVSTASIPARSGSGAAASYRRLPTRKVEGVVYDIQGRRVRPNSGSGLSTGVYLVTPVDKKEGRNEDTSEPNTSATGTEGAREEAQSVAPQ
jgi:alkaline phosphatase D